MTAQFSINFRGHIGDDDHSDQRGHALELVLNKANLDANGGNAARTEVTANQGHVSAEKTLVFDVFEKCNLAYYDEVAFEAWTGTAVPTSAGLYYKMYRNGKDVTEIAKNGGILIDNIANGSGTEVKYRLSDIAPSEKYAAYAPGDVVIYTNNDETIGAGTYKFQLFEVKLSGNNYVATTINGGMKNVNVKVDTGSYKLHFRDKVKAPTEAESELLKCFVIMDDNGATSSLQMGTDTLGNWVKFGGSTRYYKVIRNYNRENINRPGETAFVEKIVFWENVGEAYAEYVVPINCFIEIGE
jgi:hypothetical protein